MEIRKSLYLDTNAFIYAYFFIMKSGEDNIFNDTTYFKKGNSIIDALNLCRDKGVRVFSTDIAFLEITHNYYEWAKLRKYLELGAPPGLIFGKNQRMDHELLNERLTVAEQEKLMVDNNAWLRSWEFNDLIEFKKPDEIPNWLEIAKLLNYYVHGTVLDSIHLAAAISIECDFLLTEDNDLRKSATSLRSDASFKKKVKKEFGIGSSYGLPDPVKAQTFRG